MSFRHSLLCLTLASLSLTAADKTEKGFSPLFDGTTLKGWILMNGKGPGYVVRDGTILCPTDGGGNLFTDKEYGNFVLRLEFKFEAGGNNGVGIRAPLEGDAAYAGMEIQILDHDHEKYKGWLKPTQRHGAVYDSIPPIADALKPAGEWNIEEITADGRKVRVILNGVLITDADLDSVTDPAILKKHPGLARTKGHIGWLGHGSNVQFRNIRIKELGN